MHQDWIWAKPPNQIKAPPLTWNGLVVGQIKHDDEHKGPGDDESQH